MKKQLLIGAGLLAGAIPTAMAQQATSIHEMHEITTEEVVSSSTSNSSRVTNYNDTIWFDGFENPSSWTATKDNAPSDGWIISNASGTNQGSWYFQNTRINSTTGGNYAIMVPDNPNSAVMTEAILHPNAAVDISAYSGQNLVLHYEYYAARFIDTLSVEVSGDNTNWISLDKHQNLPITSLSAGTNISANPSSKELFIPVSVVNSDSLYIRFNWIGQTAQPGIGYGWFVDDVMVLDVLNNDLVIDQTGWFDPVRILFSWYFGAMPVAQASADSIFVGATHINYGKNMQNNVQLTMDVVGPVNASYNSGTTSTAAGTSGDTLYTDVGGYWMPDAIGSYDVSWVISSDSTDDNLSNNSHTVQFDVSNNIYSMAPYPISAANAVGKSGPLGTTANGGPYTLTQDYYFMANDSIVEIGVAFDSEWSEPVSAFQLSLLDANGSQVAQTAITSVTSAMITDDIVWFPMQTPAAVTPGTYEAQIEYFGNVGDSLFVVDSQDPAAPNEPAPGGGFFSRTTLSYGGNNFISDMAYIVLRTADACGGFAADVTVDAQPNCGSSNGSLTASIANGGVMPFTYAWSNGGTSATITGLTAGTYTVTITDNNGCPAIQQVDLEFSDAPEAGTSSVSDVNCFGGSDGSISIDNITGGSAPYSYAWSNGSTAQNPSNLAAGTYTVTISDNTGCTGIESYDVTEPGTAVSATVDVSVVGQATANGNGGTPGYTYAWSTGETTQTISGSGSVTVTVTDANGCEANESGNISPVSTNDIELASNLILFPNPTNGVFNVSFENIEGVYTVSVVSTIGQVVENRTIVAGSNHVETFDLNGLNNGIYFVTIASETGSEATYRVVIK